MRGSTLPRPIPPTDEQAFWLVWSPEGPTEPKMRYSRQGAARYAARMMAKKHPGQTFFVLKAKIVARCEAGASEIAEGWLADPPRRGRRQAA